MGTAVASGAAQAPTSRPVGAPPSTQAALAVPVEQQPFDPAEYLVSDVWGSRRLLYQHGIEIDPYLIADYSNNFLGGLKRGDSFRQRFNLPLQIDTDRLAGLPGGTFFAVYQLQHGGNASKELVGDAQNFSFGTDADGRSQLGQLWYQQKFLDFRLRGGKLDGNADFDVMENAQEFLNNSFQTSPTLYLMPSFPDTGMGIQLFYEPESGYYAGAGIFDGSVARGVHTGEYGPSHFLDRADNLFLIAETGAHYKLQIDGRRWPGKLGVGGWWCTDPLPQLNGRGATDGTGGLYATFDQLLWRPFRQRPVPAGPPGATPSAQPQEQEYPGGIGTSASISWADPMANPIDANAAALLTWTGMLPARPIDIAGVGTTWAHFSSAQHTRDPYELAFEAFYRIRFTQWISLKPDLQYILHPSGSGRSNEPVRDNALVLTLRLEVAF
ncbi:MAG TPA: carbohydrate porin [Tepidisphaeraceae bacterium]|nr:carbohydrate porin [Tepidisphaeraceae bacterium]